MDEFKLRSIDDFDSDFVKSLQPEEAAPKPAPVKSTLIPDFEDGTIPVSKDQQDTPAITGEPLYRPERMSRTDVDIDSFSDKYDEEPEYEKPKAGIGALIGKIAAIALLVVTVLVFVSGCFVAIFLDNKGSTVMGMSLNTLAHDTALGNNANLKKGDLLISSRKPDADYTVGSHLAVPTTDAASKGCDIVTITQVTAEGAEESYVVRQPGDNYGVSSVYTKSTSYGVVTRYVPGIGGLLGFAMDNAIWFCAMFVLLAAVCICILVLINWTVANKAKSKEEEE